MATRQVVLLIGGLIFSGFALLFFIIGYSTEHWLELSSDHNTRSGFKRIGLWRACFEEFKYYKDYPGKSYTGCNWIFSYEYRPIWEFINPKWFLAIQVMMTLSLIMEVTAVSLSLLFLFKCCPGKHSRNGLLFLGGCAILAGVFTGLCVAIFGTASVVDRQWIENPDKTYLSWSFGFVVFSGFLVIFGGVCIITSALQIQLEKVQAKRRKPYAGYDAQHEPPKYFT